MFELLRLRKQIRPRCKLLRAKIDRKEKQISEDVSSLLQPVGFPWLQQNLVSLIQKKVVRNNFKVRKVQAGKASLEDGQGLREGQMINKKPAARAEATTSLVERAGRPQAFLFTSSSFCSRKGIIDWSSLEVAPLSRLRRLGPLTQSHQLVPGDFPCKREQNPSSPFHSLQGSKWSSPSLAMLSSSLPVRPRDPSQNFGTDCSCCQKAPPPCQPMPTLPLITKVSAEMTPSQEIFSNYPSPPVPPSDIPNHIFPFPFYGNLQYLKLFIYWLTFVCLVPFTSFNNKGREHTWGQRPVSFSLQLHLHPLSSAQI